MIIQGKVWGETSQIFNKNNVELHYVHINKGGYCSKHKHRFKYNRFVILRGKLKVTIWKEYADTTLEDVTILESGRECTVPPGEYHRFEALEDCLLFEIYWVDLNENDIVRKDNGGMLDEAETNICSYLGRTGENSKRTGSAKQSQASSVNHAFNLYEPIISER